MSRIALDGIVLGLQPVGGITTYFWELASRLARDEGSEVILGLPRTLVTMLAPQFESLPLAKRRDARPVPLARYLNAPSWAHIVHTSYYRPCAHPHVQSIVTVYDFVYERYRAGLAAKVHGWQKRLACRRAAVIACISAHTRNDLLTFYPEIDPDRVVVTPLAVDHNRFYATECSHAAFGNTVVFIGQRAGYKRFDLAVAAVAQTDCSLAIIGPELDDAETEMLTAAMPGRWRMLGRVADDELRSIYGGAYALIYPSDYEGFGLPVLEAQACGCPVVTSLRSSLPEVGGAASVYAREQTAAAYRDALDHLHAPGRRAEVVTKGLANAAKFQWERTYQLTRQLYDRVG